jgi:hypothetical protein
VVLSRALRTRELELEVELGDVVDLVAVVVVAVARILGGSLGIICDGLLFREGGLGAAAVSLALVLAFVRTIFGTLGVLTAVEFACWSRDRILRPTELPGVGKGKKCMVECGGGGFVWVGGEPCFRFSDLMVSSRGPLPHCVKGLPGLHRYM